MVQVLSKVNICKFDSFNEYNFCYSYIYYFFIAKYLAEHFDEKRELINNIIANLHKDENAYITIFIAHHTKSNSLLDEIILNAEILFEKFSPASLDTNELSFFDRHEERIVKAVLPAFGHSSEEERKKMLFAKSKMEAAVDNVDVGGVEVESDFDKATLEFAANLRLSIKTVEVMGLIIKSRSGSLSKDRLEYMYEQGIKVHLRVAKSFIDLIRDEAAEKEIIDFLTERIRQAVQEKANEDQELSIEEIEKLVRSIYWNVNFGVLHGFITKAIHSLGSSNLLNISQAVSQSLNTPSAFIIYHGIRLWYGKNFRLDEIALRLKKGDFSNTARNLLNFKIVEHCRLHSIDYKDLQKIEQKLGIPISRIRAGRFNSKG